MELFLFCVIIKNHRIYIFTDAFKGGHVMSIAACIEHTNLKPEATPEDIRNLCQEARTY